MKNPGSAGGLAAGDLPGFPELRGGFSTLSCLATDAHRQTTKTDRLSYLVPGLRFPLSKQ